MYVYIFFLNYLICYLGYDKEREGLVRSYLGVVINRSIIYIKILCY